MERHTPQKDSGDQRLKASILCLDHRGLQNSLRSINADGCYYPEAQETPSNMRASNFILFNALSLAVACLRTGVLIYCDRDFFQPLLIHTAFSKRTNLHHNGTMTLNGKLISA